MKTNRLISALLFLVILIGTFTITAMAANGIKVVLNGIELSFDAPPRLIDDRTMVPMRKIFEALGATVEWYEDAQVAQAIKNDTVIQIKIDSTLMIINQQPIWLDVPPQIIDGRTLVPVRAVAEGLDAVVKWDASSQTVTITKEETTISTPEPTPNLGID